MRLLVDRMLLVSGMARLVTSQCSKAAAGMRVSDLAAVVLARPDTIRAQNIIEACTSVRPGVSPILDGLEHGPVCLIMHVAQGRMVEHTKAVVQDLLFRDLGMLPGIQHPRSDILEDS
jgi:hypothetical protein